MEGCPFGHQSHCPWRQLARNDPQAVDCDSRLVLRVLCVEVRRCMIGEVHLDDDAIKATDFRHPRESIRGLGRSLPATSRSNASTWRLDKGRGQITIQSLRAKRVGPN